MEGNKCDSFVIESAVIPQLNSGVMMVLFRSVRSLGLIIMFPGFWRDFEIGSLLFSTGINLHGQVGASAAGNIRRMREQRKK